MMIVELTSLEHGITIPVNVDLLLWADIDKTHPSYTKLWFGGGNSFTRLTVKESLPEVTAKLKELSR